MDPYIPYGCGSNTFEPSRNHRSKKPPPESSQVVLSHQQQQLPPFREVILASPLSQTVLIKADSGHTSQYHDHRVAVGRLAIPQSMRHYD